MKIFSMQPSMKNRISLENLNLEIQNDEINSTISSISLQSNSNSSIDDDLTSLSWLIELNKSNSTFPDSIIKPILEINDTNNGDLNSHMINEKKLEENLNCNSNLKNKKYLSNLNSNFKLSNGNSKIFKSVKHTSTNFNKIQNCNTSEPQSKGTNRRQSAIDRFNNFIEQVKKTKIEYDLLSDSYEIDSVNKPPFNYSQIIGMAMIENGRMTLQQICNWIQMKFCYYRKRSNWNNSIRHNLSLQFCFRKIDRNKYEKGKGGYWELAMDLKKSERKRIRNRKSTSSKCKITADQSNRNRNRDKNQTSLFLTSPENKNDSNCTLNLPSGAVLNQIILNSIQELPIPLNKSKDINEIDKDQEMENEIKNVNEQIESNSFQIDQTPSIIIDSQEICNVYNEILNNLDVTEDELNAALSSHQSNNLILNNHVNEDFPNKKCDTKSMDTFMTNSKVLLTTESQYPKNQMLDDKNVVVSSYLNNLKPINGPNVIVESLPILYSTFLTRTKSDDKNENDSNFTITSPPSSILSNTNSIVLNSSICCSCYNCSCSTYKNNDDDCSNSKTSVITIVESQLNQKIEDKFGREHENSVDKCNQNCEYPQENFLLNQTIQQNFLRPFLDNIDEAFNILRNSETEYRGCDDLLDGIYDISVNDF